MTNLICKKLVELLEQLPICFVVVLGEVVDGHQMHSLDVVRSQDLAPAWEESVLVADEREEYNSLNVLDIEEWQFPFVFIPVFIGALQRLELI